MPLDSDDQTTARIAFSEAHYPRRALWVAASAAALIHLGAISPASAQTAQPPPTTLPTISVEAKKQTAPAKKKAPAKSSAPRAQQANRPQPPAPSQPAEAPGRRTVETATSPVQDYVATRSGTGTKTDTPLRETPQSISVVGAEQMRDQGVQSLQEAVRYTPGVLADGFGFDSRGDYIIVRGIPAAYFLDGMRTTNGYYANTAAAEPYSLERVEVLRGPASMLYGQATTGGIINMISKRPQETPHAEIGVEYGSYDWKQFKFDVGGPVPTDTRWLYRMVGVARDSDTQVDYVQNDRLFFAPSLTFRPSGDTSITLLGTVRRDDGGSTQQFLPHEGTLYPNSITGERIPRRRFVGEPGDYNDTEQQSVSLLVDHKLAPWLELHHGTRYTHTDNTYSTHYPAPLTTDLVNLVNFQFGIPFLNPANVPFVDPTRQEIARVYLWRNTETDVVTSDTNLTAKVMTGGIAHKLTGGVDYTRYATGGSGTPILVDNLLTPNVLPPPFAVQSPFNVYRPTYGRNAYYLNFTTGLLEPSNNFTVTKRSDETQTQTGVYVQDQINLGNWTAVVGARNDWLKIEQAGIEDQDLSEATVRAGLMYHFWFGLTPYVSYSQAFSAQPGNQVIEDPLNPVDPRPADPLQGDQIEVGVKFQPRGAPFVINAAYFDLTEKNRLVSDVLSSFSLQGAEARIRGFEIEAAGSLTENFKVIGAYTYMDGEYEDHFNAFEIGTPVEGVPHHMASLWGIYTMHTGFWRGFSIGGGARYIGEMKDYGKLVTGDLGTITTPDVTLFDAMIAYEKDGWRWQLVAQNLEDTYYLSLCTVRGDCGIGQGRTVITSLSYKF